MPLPTFVLQLQPMNIPVTVTVPHSACEARAPACRTSQQVSAFSLGTNCERVVCWCYCFTHVHGPCNCRPGHCPNVTVSPDAARRQFVATSDLHAALTSPCTKPRGCCAVNGCRCCRSCSRGMSCQHPCYRLVQWLKAQVLLSPGFLPACTVSCGGRPAVLVGCVFHNCQQCWHPAAADMLVNCKNNWHVVTC